MFKKLLSLGLGVALVCTIVSFTVVKHTSNKSTVAVANTVVADSVLNTLKAGNKSISVVNFSQFEKLMLHKDDNKTYVINFWATWCAPCVKELPSFEKLAANFKNKNVEVILVSMDFPKMAEKQLIPFVTKNKLQSRVVLMDDPNQNYWIPKVAENWSGQIPATLIYNKKNRNFYEHSFTYNELEETLIKNMKYN